MNAHTWQIKLMLFILNWMSCMSCSLLKEAGEPSSIRWHCKVPLTLLQTGRGSNQSRSNFGHWAQSCSDHFPLKSPKNKNERKINVNSSNTRCFSEGHKITAWQSSNCVVVAVLILSRGWCWGAKHLKVKRTLHQKWMKYSTIKSSNITKKWV